MISALNAAAPVERREWVYGVLRAKFGEGASAPIREPLWNEIVAPILVQDYERGDAEAAVLLAEACPPASHVSAAGTVLGRTQLWREAYRRNPDDGHARSELISAMANYIKYTLHELPAGVLYEVDGATTEQCEELAADVAEYRRLLDAEDTAGAELADLAAYHYSKYPKYLASREPGDTYAAFLERAAVGDFRDNSH